MATEAQNLEDFLSRETTQYDDGVDINFCSFGCNIFDSEDLTNVVYQTYLDMAVEGWSCETSGAKKDFPISDIGLIYQIGPYIPCVERVAFTREIDPDTDGFPGIRIVSNLGKENKKLYAIRPVKNFPKKNAYVMGKIVKRYKLIVLTPGESEKDMRAYITWFGVNSKGRIVSAYDKTMQHPDKVHGFTRFYASLAINAWADSRYHWIARTQESIIGSHTLKLWLGLDKDHIKSLFYARSLPLTETGRKRPILHWVRAHKKRMKEGIDIDIEPYLRGITEFEMDNVKFTITQPDKSALHGAEVHTVREAREQFDWKN